MTIKGSVETLLSRVGPEGRRHRLTYASNADRALCQRGVRAVGVGRKGDRNIGGNDRGECTQEDLLGGLPQKRNEARGRELGGATVGNTKESANTFGKEAGKGGTLKAEVA